MGRDWGEAVMAAVSNGAWLGAMTAGAFAIALGGERILGLALG